GVLEAVVRLDLCGFAQVADGESTQVAHSAERTDAQRVNAELAFGGDGNRRFESVVLGRFEGLEPEPGRVEEDFAGGGQTAAGERNSCFFAALDAVGSEGVDLGVAGESRGD